MPHTNTLMRFPFFPYFTTDLFSLELYSRAKHKTHRNHPSLAGWRVCEEFLKHFDWQLTTLSRVRRAIFISYVKPAELSICHSKMPNFSIYIMLSSSSGVCVCVCAVVWVWVCTRRRCACIRKFMENKFEFFPDSIGLRLRKLCASFSCLLFFA